MFFFFWTKTVKKLTVGEVVSNLLTLLTSTSSIGPSQETSRPNLFTASQETLIGRRICHRWKDSDGVEQWYYGNILSLVPGINDWFNVQYDVDVILYLLTRLRHSGIVCQIVL